MWNRPSVAAATTAKAEPKPTSPGLQNVVIVAVAEPDGRVTAVDDGAVHE